MKCWQDSSLGYPSSKGFSLKGHAEDKVTKVINITHTSSTVNNMADSESLPQLPNSRDPKTNAACTTDSLTVEPHLSLITETSSQHVCSPNRRNSRSLVSHNLQTKIVNSTLDMLDQQSLLEHEHLTQNTINSFALSPYEYKNMLKLIWPNTTPLHWEKFHEFKQIYNTVKSTTLPNYLSAKIPLTSGLNIPAWRQEL